MSKAQKQTPSLKENLRDFIKIEGELLEEPKDPKFTFSFVFSYPKGKDKKTGKPLSPVFQINKKKNSKFVIISSKIGFLEKDFDKLKLNGAYIKFTDSIKRIILMRDVDFRIEIENSNPSILIFDRLDYPITHFSFWKTLRHVFFTGLMIVNLLRNYIKGKKDGYEFGTSSLYT